MKFAEQSRAMGLDDSANRSRMNLLSINKPIEQPNYLGAILSGAETGMSAYSFGKDAVTKTTTTASGLGAGATDLVKPLNFNQAYS